MFGIARFSTSLLAASLLLACGYFEDDPPYPPIDKEKLIGCWVAADFGGLGWACDERCFSRNNLYYSRVNSDTTFNSNFVEIEGNYYVGKNGISLLVIIGNNVEKPDSVLKKWDYKYTIIHDTLFSINSGGKKMNPFVRADSSNTCGPHWQVFPEPEGWDLN